MFRMLTSPNQTQKNNKKTIKKPSKNHQKTIKKPPKNHKKNKNEVIDWTKEHKFIFYMKNPLILVFFFVNWG